MIWISSKHCSRSSSIRKRMSESFRIICTQTNLQRTPCISHTLSHTHRFLLHLKLLDSVLSQDCNKNDCQPLLPHMSVCVSVFICFIYHCSNWQAGFIAVV